MRSGVCWSQTGIRLRNALVPGELDDTVHLKILDRGQAASDEGIDDHETRGGRRELEKTRAAPKAVSAAFAVSPSLRCGEYAGD